MTCSDTKAAEYWHGKCEALDALNSIFIGAFVKVFGHAAALEVWYRSEAILK